MADDKTDRGANTQTGREPEQEENKNPEKNSRFLTGKRTNKLAVTLLVTSAGLFAMFFFKPSVELLAMDFPESTKIYDRSGTRLYELYGEVKRTPIPLAEIPMSVQNATIAIEDKNFYTHIGVNPTSIVRAALVNLRTRSLREGGSTISQQLVRASILSRRKTFVRKFQEAVLSLELERLYSKTEILDMYLNRIPYGSNAYGVEAASQTFFGKHVRELTVMEAAYLAALPKAPTYYSPYGAHREELDARARLIIKLMTEQGYLSPGQALLAAEQTVAFKKPVAPIQAPHFVMHVIEELKKTYSEEQLRQGLQVVTTLDLSLQKLGEEIIRREGPKNEKRYHAGNAALVAIDPRTGEILAMVGSRNYFDLAHDGQVNVATRPRQPGSSFKPYVYATAFMNGMNPATMLMDVRTNFGRYGSRDYIPRNYDGREHGPVSVRQALAGSLNIPAVKTLLLTGIDKSVATARAMGITTLADSQKYGPAIVLGGAEVTLLDHTSAFGVFATNGARHAPQAIMRVTDRVGNILDDGEARFPKQVLDPPIAYQITSILSDRETRKFIFGSLSKNLVLPDRPVAAKTGTTQNNRDAWTIGYTPSLVAGVWVGNNDNRPMRAGSDGSVVAAPIWNEFMRRALADTLPEEFARPEGIIELAVDKISGKLPGKRTQETKIEIFTADNLPGADDLYQSIQIGEEISVVPVYHSEKPNDPHWEQGVQKWLAANNFYPYLPPPPEPEPPPAGATIAELASAASSTKGYFDIGGY